MPSEKLASPRVTATAEPELEPPEMVSGSKALRVAPQGERVPTRPVANWSRLVLPIGIAPAAVVVGHFNDDNDDGRLDDWDHPHIKAVGLQCCVNASAVICAVCKGNKGEWKGFFRDKSCHCGENEEVGRTNEDWAPLFHSRPSFVENALYSPFE